MRLSRCVLVSLVGVSLLVCGANALAGTAHMVLLNGTDADTFQVDLDPGTIEQMIFEIVADSSEAAQVGGFEWQLGFSGSGLAFNATASESMSRALATDGAHVPQYLLFNDSDGFDAALSTKGLRGGDTSATQPPTGHNAAGRSLGVAVVTITDENAAQGWHNIQDPASFFLLTDFETTEPLAIPEFQFEVTPEPATLGFLAVGGLVALWRRRR